MTRSNPIQFSDGQRVTLAFRARWWYVDNPTGSTVYLREGNTDVPSGIASADMFVPALSARVIPCNASEFGLGFGAPVSTAPAGLPTSAVALFGDESEPMPSIGSEAALSTIVAGTVTTVPSGTQNVTGTVTADVGAGTQAVSGQVTTVPPGAALLDGRSFASAGAKTYNVAIIAGTKAVILEIASNTHGLFSDLTVIGQQTGIVYYGGKTAPLSDAFPIYMPVVVPIYSPSDTGVTIQFTYNSATGSTWLVYALAGDAPATLGAGGAQMVREFPAPLVASASGFVGTPAAGAVIATTGALPAGDYRIEAELSSNDNVAGKYMLMTRRDAADAVSANPTFPLIGAGNIAVVWLRVTLAAGERVSIRADPGGSAGSLYAGCLRTYRIS
jgi:hypothetical protein